MQMREESPHPALRATLSQFWEKVKSWIKDPKKLKTLTPPLPELGEGAGG
ncbi:hypothetical protein CCAX7_23790 [Capsulimonas corticalis]|uniref:Uncharacterized protein n=1 Tax=Capsulimonas corticalis TaxID=2219043 RepID=A0A402CV94_9BACT|nr:hypothetical protein CCAX7_23790 [Capsulimonas corticalis]